MVFLGWIIFGVKSAEDRTCWFLSGDGRTAFGMVHFFFNRLTTDGKESISWMNNGGRFKFEFE